jgi:hypothetical protein
VARQKATKKAEKPALSRSLIQNVWFFPAVLSLFLVLLTCLRISGSSIGIYNTTFYGQSKDPALLLNGPESIRSDEWLVTTQLTMAQHAAGYPRVNPNIDSGRDMSVVGDAPYKDWSSLFRPQNLAFFVLPFENAYAFKWWLLLYLVITSCYFFTLRILPGKKLFAAIFGTAVGLSPFLFWWYQTGTLACIFYSLFILILVMRIINGEKIRFLGSVGARYSYLGYTIGLAYLVACFALILYPPFQIPIAIVTAFFGIGLFLDSYGSKRVLLSRESMLKLSVFLASIVMALVIVFVFFHTRQSVVSAITNTVYPGKRTVQTEGSSGYEILSTFLQPQLQRLNRAANYYTNQSEASNFILLLPFLFIPGCYLLYKEYRKDRRLNWPLLSIQLCIILFLAYLFVPAFKPLYRLFALDKVANVRLFIGLGLAGVIQMLLILKSLEVLKLPTKKLNIGAGLYVLVCAITVAWVGLYARTKYPEFIRSLLLIGSLGFLFCSIIFCFLSRRALLGSIIFLLFSIGCTYRIHPVYRGMGPLYNGDIIRVIDRVSKPGDSWAALDSLYYENFPAIANRDALSGVKPYPDVSFWRQVAGSKDDYYYNRYAHVIFNEEIKSDFVLGSPDSFQVRFACTPFIKQNLDFALSTHQLNLPCTREVQEVHYPALTFYLYKVD